MRSLHICFVPGRAAWDRATWLTHTAAIKRGAQRATQWGQLHGIPMRHLSPAEVATPGVKGICTHGDVTAAGYKASEGHTDPGPNFPMDVFLSFAQGQAPPVDEEIEDMIIKAPQWQQKNPDRPACARLDMAIQKIQPMNGARFTEPDLTVPTPPDTPGVNGWYETFNPDGSKKGCVVIGKNNTKDGFPKYEYTWLKQPGT
jgi:hypothetical protein